MVAIHVSTGLSHETYVIFALLCVPTNENLNMVIAKLDNPKLHLVFDGSDTPASILLMIRASLTTTTYVKPLAPTLSNVNMLSPIYAKLSCL